MKTLVDSSAFAKRYIEESGSQEVDDLLQSASELGLSVICVPEIVSALNRSVRERRLPARDYATAKGRLAEDVADATVVNLTPGVISRATHLLESHPLRAMDALHVACALEWGADLFVSCDDRQLSAARRAGLRTKKVPTG